MCFVLFFFFCARYERASDRKDRLSLRDVYERYEKGFLREEPYPYQVYYQVYLVSYQVLLFKKMKKKQTNKTTYNRSKP